MIIDALILSLIIKELGLFSGGFMLVFLHILKIKSRFSFFNFLHFFKNIDVHPNTIGKLCTAIQFLYISSCFASFCSSNSEKEDQNKKCQISNFLEISVTGLNLLAFVFYIKDFKKAFRINR